MVAVGDARDRFSELLGEVERTHERVTITRHGKPVAVMLSPDDLSSLEETMDIMATPGALADIHDSAADIDAGRTVGLAEIQAELRATS